jgi:hypothetical protein
MASAADYSSDSEYQELSSISSRSPSPISVPRPSNPTEILQTGYNSFKTDKRYANFTVRLDTACSREDFYYALFAIDRFDTPGSIAIIKKCAESFGNPADPVDAAIRCYSILIRNLYANKRQLADVVVCDFLRSLPGEEKYFIKKMQCLYLILTDRAAYDAAPQEIKDEILISLRDQSSYLHLVLSTKEPNNPDVMQANAVLRMNGLPNVHYNIPETRVQKPQFPDLMIDTFGIYAYAYAGGRKLKLKLRSKSRSSRNKSKRKNKNKKNKKKTLRLRIKK